MCTIVKSALKNKLISTYLYTLCLEKRLCLVDVLCSWNHVLSYLQDKGPDCHSNIQPDGIMGQNIFNIPPDEVRLTCNVTYYGIIPPQMEWKNVGDNSFSKNIYTSVATSTNRVTYTLKLKGDISLDNSSYVCQTTRSTQNQYKCTSETIKVLCKYRTQTCNRIIHNSHLGVTLRAL